MNKELAQASIGKIVYRTDGTPRPPARFNKKVQAWEAKNYSGKLTEVKPYFDGQTNISIEVKNMGYAIFNFSGVLNDNVHLGEHPDAPADASVKV